jgi:hypothetical protein
VPENVVYTAVGVARPLLVSAVKGYETVVEWLEKFLMS